MDEIKKALIDISMLPTVRLLLALSDTINDNAYFCSSSFLCQNCFGILINPKIFKSCKTIFCEFCSLKVSENKVFCLCKKTMFENILAYHNIELENTFYVFNEGEEKLDYFSAIKRLSRLIPEMISKKIFKILNIKILENNKHQITNIYQFPKGDLTISPKGLRIQIKLRKILHFCYIKGIKLKISNKFCLIDKISFIQNMHLKSITILNCHINIGFALILSRTILQNRRRLKTFIYAEKEESDFKITLIILKAISACINITILGIKSLRIIYKRNDRGYIKVKNRYEYNLDFLYFKNNLQILHLENIYFNLKSELEYLEFFSFLKEFKIEDCKFSLKLFTSILFQIRKINYLEILTINRYSIINREKEEKNKETLDLFQMFPFKFSQNPRKISFQNYYGNFHLDSFYSNFYHNFSIDLILHFLQMCQNLEKFNLSLNSHLQPQQVDKLGSLFIDFKMLKEFKLEVKYPRLNIKNFLQHVFLCNTLEILQLNKIDLLAHSMEVSEFLRKSEKIKILNLASCNLSITIDLCELAFAKKFLQFIDLRGNYFPTEILVQFDRKYLRKIKIDENILGEIIFS